MIFSSMAALFVGLSSPLAHAGVAVNHFSLGPRALVPMAAAVPLRIMALGASITYGQGSSEGNGYRAALLDQLTGAGNNVEMVGSRPHGTMKNSMVEGWPGFRIDQVHAKAKESVPQTKPNVFLINVGTNDAVQNRNVSTAGERMEAMIEDLFTMSPRATVILSTLLVNRNRDTERNVQSINRQFGAVVTSLQNRGRRIILVDMHDPNYGPLVSDLVDDTHPNDVGYRKMANIWYWGINNVSDRSWLQPPESLRRGA
ncbi:SGNH hydrolase-type esterase domain-containing protein [Cercophora newfieldiana]|uniref:SGNH hydrolase-type esterase domain-containing protein n=1 Tax=Cercophora newfieldiana TaxID=92897 RepID=A0AA39Y0A8_9PEZI|nr:SGNH hydrolase-type esterase domain-containing protein [Cercophora newfieldiana]